jgi:hypothetical protein
MDDLYRKGDKLFYQGHPVTVIREHPDDGFDYTVDAGKNDIFGCDENTLSPKQQERPNNGW